MFLARSPGKPACRYHANCKSFSIEHWKDYDHPSTHPFLVEQQAYSQRETSPLHKRMCVEKTPEKTAKRKLDHTNDEPLAVGDSTTIIGSKGDSYTIKRHPDKNGKPFYWCTCPSRKYHGTKGDDTCKHIEELRGSSGFVVSSSTQSLGTNVLGSATPHSHKFPVALAETYDPTKHDPIGMCFMEKFDGFYARWDNATKNMFSRNANIINIPQWMKDQMPSISVTGELYGGKGQFNNFQGLFNGSNPSDPQWRQASFLMFDVVEDNLNQMLFKDRMQFIADHKKTHVYSVNLTDCTSVQQLKNAFNAVVQNNGEGLVLRKNAPYKAGRSSNILKYKKSTTIDGKIFGYTSGTGRYANFIGSVRLKTRSGMEFKCVPPNRLQPPPIGTIVEVECMELTSSGVPRHPRWLRIRTDISF